MIVSELESGDHFIKTAGIFVIGDCHATLRRIRIIEEPVASKFKGLVVVLLNQVKYFRVNRHHTVSPGLCFHTTDNIAFFKMHVL